MFLTAHPLPPMEHRAPAHTFRIEQGKFMLDGKPMLILAGEMHYFRVPQQLWRQRIKMAKAMGLNTIATYVFWNMHEPEKGKFDFSGNADIAKFIKTCQEEGMYVLLRPGPYACAEWEFGGYPYWLLKDPSMKIRSDNPAFLEASKNYLTALAKQTAPLQVTRGGNILMVQVENEYGSYGRDHAYMQKVKDMLTSAGYDVPLYVAEGGPQLAGAWIPGTVAGVNGGGWPDIVKTVDKYTPGGPYMSPEFYPGWLDHWGEPKSVTDGDVQGYKELISHGVSVSMYMFHGGTNFGFMNGANYGGHYQPDITSYDYDSPLDETGRPRKKYFQFRDAIASATGATLPEVPKTEPYFTLPTIALTKTGTLWGAVAKPISSKTPMTFEELNQAYGDVLYKTHISKAGPAHLEIKEVRDYAVVVINHKIVGEIDRRRSQHGADIEIPEGGADLELLVENSGRINYGGKLPDNLHGITKSVTLDRVELTDWQIYKFPLDDPSKLHLDGKVGGPSLYKGEFSLDSTGDAFLDMRGWHKGAAWINGHALGRFWWIGPQQTLYVPSVWLKKGKNSVIVFDMEGKEHASIQGSPEPILNDLKSEKAEIKRDRATLDHTPDLSKAPAVVSASLKNDDAQQTFKFSTQSGRYLAIETRSTFAGEDFASLAEVELLSSDGFALDRSKWKIAYVDSEETAQESTPAENLLDGDPESIWHSVWSAAHAGQPHFVVIDLGKTTAASAVRITPRQGEHPGKTKDFSIFLLDKI